MYNFPQLFVFKIWIGVMNRGINRKCIYEKKLAQGSKFTDILDFSCEKHQVEVLS